MTATQAPAGAGDEPVVRDVVDHRVVRERTLLHHGRVWDLVEDTVELTPGHAVRREIVDHPGAVAVVVLDDDDRVLLVRQYRHPVGRDLWEVPAGLLDEPGEDALDAAARELREEVDLVAASWSVLVDYYTTPGGSTEALRVYLARDVSPVPADQRHVREDEEAEMVQAWVPLDDLVAAVLAGDVHNPSAVAGALAAHASRAGGWASLRPADAPWPERRTAPLMERRAEP